MYTRSALFCNFKQRRLPKQGTSNFTRLHNQHIGSLLRHYAVLIAPRSHVYEQVTRGTLDFFMRRFANMRTCSTGASAYRCSVRGSRFDRDVAAATGLHGRYVLDWLLVESNVQFAVDGGGLRWGKRTVLYLCPVTDVFQLIFTYNTFGSSAFVF